MVTIEQHYYVAEDHRALTILTDRQGLEDWAVHIEEEDWQQLLVHYSDPVHTQSIRAIFIGVLT